VVKLLTILLVLAISFVCAQAQADAKSFVEIPVIAEIDDAEVTGYREAAVAGSSGGRWLPRWQV